MHENIRARIRTTVLLRYDRYEKLLSVAEQTGRKPQQLVKELLGKYCRSISGEFGICRPTKYQNRAKKWKTFHITFSVADYEMYRDLNRILRDSLSLIVADVIDVYLDSFDEKVVLDSYPLHAYSWFSVEQQEMNIFVYCWGIPEDKIIITPG